MQPGEILEWTIGKDKEYILIFDGRVVEVQNPGEGGARYHCRKLSLSWKEPDRKRLRQLVFRSTSSETGVLKGDVIDFHLPIRPEDVGPVSEIVAEIEAAQQIDRPGFEGSAF